MTTPLETVRHLIARVTDSGSTEDEKRNSALAAIRLIVKHKMKITDRPEIPMVDISANDIVRDARKTVADEVTTIADRFAKDGFAGVVDWFKDGKEVLPHTRVVATRSHVCANCFVQTKPGQTVIVQVGEFPKDGLRKPRITCIRERCARSWTV